VQLFPMSVFWRRLDLCVAATVSTYDQKLVSFTMGLMPGSGHVPSTTKRRVRTGAVVLGGAEFIEGGGGCFESQDAGARRPGCAPGWDSSVRWMS
jgi:hypothetical protein